MHRMSTASINGAQISGLTSRALLTSTRSIDEGQASAPNLLSRRMFSGDRLDSRSKYQMPSDLKQSAGIYILNKDLTTTNSRSPGLRHLSTVVD